MISASLEFPRGHPLKIAKSLSHFAFLSVMRALLIGAGIPDGLGEGHEKPIQAIYHIKRRRRYGLGLLH